LWGLTPSWLEQFRFLLQTVIKDGKQSSASAPFWGWARNFRPECAWKVGKEIA
jgi:hypothetical protein